MPSGALADVTFFTELVRFAQKHKILICHDNPYTFILNDRPLSIFNAKGADTCAVELISLSKCYNMAGWRVGAVIGAKAYIDNIMSRIIYKPFEVFFSLGILGHTNKESLSQTGF
jgi:aspartate/methionine/tyrosine aminotransferase